MKPLNKIWMAAVLGTTLTFGSLSAATIGQRGVRQQERIAGGVATGRLTTGETARLEGQEATIHNERRTDRIDNGGYLTAGERLQLQHQRNQVSGRIFVDKHNGIDR